MIFYFTFWEVIGLIMIVALVVLAVLAIIEPGPLNRRSRTPRGDPDVSVKDKAHDPAAK